MKHWYWFILIFGLAAVYVCWLGVKQYVLKHDVCHFESSEISVYFNKSTPTDIMQVPVTRCHSMMDGTSSSTYVIQELLEGPTVAEKGRGLSTAINPGTVLNYVKIENGVATIDFNDQFDFQMGGSARVQAIYQEIYKTLTQFPTIKEIKITINYGERLANLEP